MFMVNVKGDLNKMLKIIERSKAVRIFLYFAISAGCVTLLTYRLLEVYHG